LHTPECMWTKICVDSAFWPPSSNLAFTRYDAVNYVPRHFLPACDSIYIIPCLPPQITCPDNETKGCNGTYTTTTTWSANAGGSPGILLTSVGICGQLPPGITGATVNVDPPGLPAASATGTVTYTVGDHCQGGGAICLVATNNCAPPLTAQCNFNVTLTNAAPTITCPVNVSGPYAPGMLVSGDYTATDECPGVVPTVAMTYTGTATNPPALVGKHVEWQAHCVESISITLTATDDCGATAQCSFNMSSTNSAPTITCPPDAKAFGDGLFTTGNWTTGDAEQGSITPVVVGIVPAATNMPYICGNAVCWDVDPADPEAIYTITLSVTDECGLTASCDFDIERTQQRPGLVKIPNEVYQLKECVTHNCVNPGDFFEIPIILEAPLYPAEPGVAGFELEIDFDYIDLTFYGAERGDLLNANYMVDGVTYSWEYFTYRVLPCVSCACCKNKILLYGQSEMPNGQFYQGYCLPDDHVVESECGPANDLVWLKFQVANNELLRDLKLPIVFEWEHKLSDPPGPYYIIDDWDCAENTMSSCMGTYLFVSDDSMQYDESVCTNWTQEPRPIPILTFVDGGVHICSPDTNFKCTRGDINLNHIAYEVADAVMFARYFVYGINVFSINREWQVCATDVNNDGRTLMLADLIYLIRVITRDAVPFPKLGPSSDVANLIVSDGKITVECASQIGGLLFGFDGDVNATLLNSNMELLSNEGKVLVWSSAGNSINAGASQILSISGANLTSVIAVDREGRELATTITTKLAPTNFALHSAYPNPFNPSTNLSFTLPTATPYSLNIYNVAGQLVRTYEGMGNVGLNVITWNGKDNAGNEVSSGVYFCKLIAGGFTATNKMVMMK
jgi:hypothetical protein